LNVVIVCPSPYEPPWDEGIKNLTHTLHGYLRERGCGVTVVSPRGMTSRPGRVNSRLRVAGIVARFNLLGDYVVTSMRQKPNAVFLYSSCNSFLGVKTTLFRLMGARSLILYVTSIRRPMWGYRFLLRAGSVLIGSPRLQAYFPGARLVPPFLPAGPRSFEGRQPRHLDLSRPRRILFLGAWQAGRGVEDLVEAVAIARNRIPLHLILALNSWDDRSRSELLELVERLGVEDVVTLCGFVDTEQAYQTSDLLVIPRRTQERMAFPVRIVEALAYRVPMIVTTVNSMEEIIGDCGLAVPPASPASLAEAIVRLGSDAELYATSSAACVGRARIYDPTRALEAVYEEMTRVVAAG
jgi:glycosyltransferase involved in cell wall biosynthesis